MTARKPAPAAPSAEPSCLYPGEDEIARAVLGPDRVRTWPSLAVVLERDGLPKVDLFMGGRYWPAVKAYLDRRHHVGKHEPARENHRGGEAGHDQRQRAVRARA